MNGPSSAARGGRAGTTPGYGSEVAGACGRVSADEGIPAGGRRSLKLTLVNPPTLFRWQSVDVTADPSAEPYFARLLRHDPHAVEGQTTLPGEHLGIQMLAACARNAGHEVRLVNACSHFHSSLGETLEAILREHSDVIGFSGPADVFGEIAWLAQRLRLRGVDGPFVLGNDFATLNDVRVLNQCPEIDFVVRGEGEVVLPQLLEAIAGHRGYDSIPALTWRSPSGIARNPSAQGLVLDSLPRPARDDTARVVASGMSASLFTKRGCPFRCNFCTTGQLAGALNLRASDRWRRKTPVAAADEFLALSDEFGLGHITIVDDLFLSAGRASREWVSDFATRLIDAGSTTSFMIDCRVDGVDRDLFRLLKRAGLNRVFLGVEGASANALHGLNKAYGRHDARTSLEILRELGLDAVLGFIFFTPEAELADLLANALFLRSIRVTDYELHLQRVRVYPGTALEEHLRELELLEGAFPHYTARFKPLHTARVAQAVDDAAAGFERLLPSVSPIALQAQAPAIFLTLNHAVASLIRDVERMSSSEIQSWSRDVARRLLSIAGAVLNPDVEVS